MKKLFKKQLKKGFTLVEVLITMTIIGIISTRYITIQNIITSVRLTSLKN